MDFKTHELLDRAMELNTKLANALTAGQFETLQSLMDLIDDVKQHKKEAEEALPKPDKEIKPDKKSGKKKEYKPKIEQGTSPLDDVDDDKASVPPSKKVDTDFDPLSDEAPPLQPEENDSLPF